MKLTMTASLQGPETSLAPGDLHECDDAEAQRLIDAGFAECAETDEERAQREADEAAERERVAAELGPNIDAAAKAAIGSGDAPTEDAAAEAPAAKAKGAKARK